MGTLLNFPTSSLALCFDCETTDLIQCRSLRDERLPRMIEFYGCVIDLNSNDPPFSELELLIDPGCEIPEKIQKLTHITSQMVINQPKFSEVAKTIRDFLHSSPLVIAHNASFDKEMVDIEMGRAGIQVQWPETVCTVEQTVHFFGKRMTLGELHEHLIGHKFKDAHRARHDVEALVRIARHLRRERML